MADFIAFNEGRCIVEDGGWPSTVSFDLSTKAVSGFTAADTYASRGVLVVGSSPGYAVKTQVEPTATGLGSKVFPTALTWANGASGWQNPCSIVAHDGTKIICAWNLVAGGAARDMSQPNTTLNVTPTYAPTNPP